MNEKYVNNNTYLRFSRITGKNYNVFETIKILNLTQAMAYIDNDVMPVDIQIGRNKDGKRCLVFIFVKSDTAEVFDKWCNYEL